MSVTKETSSQTEPRPVHGRLLALDLGTRCVGVAISDELRLTVRPLPPLARTNWKRLVRAVGELLERFDAQALVLGLPLRMDGTEGEAACEARRLACNFARSLSVPVHLQDERLTSWAAEEALRAGNLTRRECAERIDSEAATLILRDFLTKK